MKRFIPCLVLLLAAAPGAGWPGNLPYTPVVTPNGTTLPWEMKDGVKVFRLTVEQCQWEVSPGMVINAWCYNGQTPGPTIEAVEGDRVRFYVTNKLPEPTAVHWHGILLPSGMDGVQGLNQKGIPPGETYVYEFTLRQHGTQMYHSHGDEMVQIGLGTMGFFIIHPKTRAQRIDRDFALFLNEWFVAPGSKTPNPHIMTDFSIFTFNSRAFPGTQPLVARSGDRVRVRVGNVGQETHPIHLHGHTFRIVATAGDWALHCHRRHHPMNAMDHDIPNVLGVSQEGLEAQIQGLVPEYMAMGETGMHEHSLHGGHMQGPQHAPDDGRSRPLRRDRDGRDVHHLQGPGQARGL